MQVQLTHVQTTEFPCSSGAAHQPMSRCPAEQWRREQGMRKERRRGLLARRRAGNVHWVWNRAKATLSARKPQKRETERDGREERTIMASRRRERGLISGRRRGCLSLQCPSACLSAFSFSSFHQLKVVDGLLCLSSYRRPPDTSNSLAALFPFPLLAPALILSLAFSILFDLCLLPSHGPNKHNCWAFSVLLSLCAQSKGRLQTSKQPLFKLESLKLVLESLFLSANMGVCSALYFHLKAINLVGVCVLEGKNSVNNCKTIPALCVQPFGLYYALKQVNIAKFSCKWVEVHCGDVLRSNSGDALWTFGGRRSAYSLMRPKCVSQATANDLYNHIHIMPEQEIWPQLRTQCM